MRFLASSPRALWPLILAGIGACSSDPGESLNPPPILLDLSPDTLPVGAAQATLTLTGRDFVRSSRVRWNDSDVGTVVVDGRTLRVTVGAEQLSTAGEATITVFSPEPGGGTSGSLPLLVGYQAPVLQSLSPSEIEAGSPDLVLTLRGSGFASGSEVYLNNSVRAPIVSVTPTEMKVTVFAEHIAAGGSIQVRVENPNPGGGTSEARTLTMVYPLPSIVSVSPDSASADDGDIPVTITGSQLSGATEIWINGVRFNHQETTPTAIRIHFTPSRFGQGLLPLVAQNPTPGGGRSDTLWFKIGYGIPRLATLNPSATTAGGAPLTVTVTGTNFAPGATARWNGKGRATTVLNNGSLSVTLLASDIDHVTTGQIVVTTFVGTSTALQFPVIPATPVAPQVQSVDQRLVQVVWDAQRGVLWGSSPADAPAQPNRIVGVNPLTGEVTESVLLEGDPGRIAISDDYHFLYAILRSAHSAARIDLSTRQRDLQFLLGEDFIGRPLTGEDILVPAGAPHSVVVTRIGQDATEQNGVAIYDEGIQRGPTPAEINVVGRIAPGSSSDRVYGYAPINVPSRFFRLKITPGGIMQDGPEDWSLLDHFGDIESADGMVYSTLGDQVDAEKGVRLGRFPVSGPVAPEAAAGKVYFYANGEIHVFHYVSRTLLGRIPVPQGAGAVTLSRWGNDGLALTTPTQLVLVRAPLIGPGQ